MQNTIRKALSADLDAILALVNQASTSASPSLPGDDYLRQSLPYCWVLMRDEYETGDEQLAALAICKEQTIELLLVAPAMRRRGLGSALLRRCEEFMSLGHSELQLESTADDCDAHRFYQAKGWQLVPVAVTAPDSEGNTACASVTRAETVTLTKAVC